MTFINTGNTELSKIHTMYLYYIMLIEKTNYLTISQSLILKDIEKIVDSTIYCSDNDINEYNYTTLDLMCVYINTVNLELITNGHVKKYEELQKIFK